MRPGKGLKSLRSLGVPLLAVLQLCFNFNLTNTVLWTKWNHHSSCVAQVHSVVCIYMHQSTHCISLLMTQHVGWQKVKCRDLRGKSLQGVALTLTLLLFWESIFCVGARNPPFCVRLVTVMPQWNLANSSCLHCASHLCLCPLSSLVQLYSVLLCDYAVCNCVWLCVTVFSIAVSQLGRGVTTELPMGDSHATPLLRLPM